MKDHTLTHSATFRHRCLWELAFWLATGLAIGSGGAIAGTRSASTVNSARPFLGKPILRIQRLFDGRGARDIITTHVGNVLAFHGQQLRESTDGGMTWSPPREVGPDAGGCALVNETNGDVLLVRASKGYLWKSRDHGRTWTRETIRISPNGFGHGSPEGVPLSVGAFQSPAKPVHCMELSRDWPLRKARLDC